MELIIAAILYYIGCPDGKFFDEATFGPVVAWAKKAYVTLNTIMGVESAEKARFSEGKKQIPELLTVPAAKKMVDLYVNIFRYALLHMEKINFTTVRACRQSEISEGESRVMALTSTTKLSTDEIMELGYGNKNGLAIVRYVFHDGAIICDMETLGGLYGKPEEREVLILTGNRLVARCDGYDERYRGKDGEPALCYTVDVYPPEPATVEHDDIVDLRSLVFKEKALAEIQEFYRLLNNSTTYPEEPACYRTWKQHFQQLVLAEVLSLL